MDLSPIQKRAFIDWFMEHYSMPQRELVWLFDYMLKRDELLNNIHFVFEAHLCPRSMIISVQDHDNRPFRYYKEHVVTTEVEKAFHDIRMNPEESLFVEVIYPNVRHSQEYMSVLEDNPYLPDDYYLKDKDYKAIDSFLDYVIQQQYVEKLKSKIDMALDKGDFQSFNYYSKRLKELQMHDYEGR
ncbi:ReoY family proteolytic degradation factor [Alkalibacillus aidingensis]|uniref:ReoY family proteolytic degradation factor n=1 Tax=Alkalibacillus aidingensis TaxID=2747607 RepID=UPI00166027D3|nr:ReoY family proteolytic degradation factor [Alkalibacillus aidingensis]